MPWSLVGRDRELASIGELLADGSTGGVVVAGAPGVGKTRLAAEAERIALERDMAVAWARATRSAASMPLGAFAALLPADPAGGSELLARVRWALAERAAGRRLLLCVDDGHLLDDASAALVHQLVAAGEAFVVVTVRWGEPVPDALRALWKDELCAFMELGDLGQAALERLLAEVLGGPLDGRSLTAIWELTLGNPLFLRELVLYGLDRGLLADDGGIWRWRGEMTAGMRLAELVGARLEGLGEAAAATLQVVAVGAPLDADLLDAGELATLEERGIVERRPGRLVDVAHPMYGDVVRGGISATRLEEIQRRLADALEARGGDVLRIAAWRLESGGASDPVLLEQAAGHALAALDMGLAERLARAAIDAGGGFDARLLLARALAAAGRAEEADELLSELDGGDDDQRAAVAIAAARNLLWGLDRAADADAALRRAEAVIEDDRVRGELIAQRVRLAAAQGRPRAALEAATSVLTDASVREPARVHAAIGAVEALLSSGRIDAALELADEWMPAARRQRDEVPQLEVVLASERGFALRLAGRLVDATAASEAVYERALRQRSAQTAAVEAYLLGYNWLARGRVRTALRLFRESAALLRDADAPGMLPVALAGVAQAAGQAGEPELARAAVDELERATLGHRGFEPELGLGRAWSAAVGGELSRARACAREAADLARSRGQSALELRALHELCRLGEPDAERLGALADEVDGPFAQIAAAHAAALATGDGLALLDVAERLADRDALLVAAEAAQAAGAAHRADGRAASARAADARAAVWLERCEGARPPTLLGTPVADELTAREREIALLAAAGSSSREIAERLVISVRTVDNHLQRVYRKLGLSRREELARVLSGEVE